MTELTQLLDLTQVIRIASVFSITYYLIQCFFGYKILKVSCSIFGFIAGFIIGFYIAVKNIPDSGYWPAVIGMAAGIGLAILAFKLYLAGVFIYCGLLASGATLLIPIPEEHPWSVVKLIVFIAAFVIVGIIAVKFSKFCIIAVTAIGGAINAILRLQPIVTELQTNLMLYYIVIVAVAAGGFAVQYFMNRD